MSELLFRPVTDDMEVLMVAGPVEIVRELGDSERDLFEVGRMFRVRSLAHGQETDAFADELTAFPSR